MTLAAASVVEGAPFVVDGDAVRRFAQAAGDLLPAYLDDDGGEVPPMFAIVPAIPVLRAAATHPSLGPDRDRLVHAAHDQTWHRPLRRGMVLSVAATVDEGTISVTEADADGVVVEIRFRLQAPQPGRPTPPPEPAVTPHTPSASPGWWPRTSPGATPPPPVTTAPSTPTPTPPAVRVSRRGAAGTCTLAIAAAALVEGPAAGDPSRLARLAGTFVAPVTPGQPLTTRLWPDGHGFAFDVLDRAGNVVIHDGRAEIHT